MIISRALCKSAVTPLLKHWSYCGLALSPRYQHEILSMEVTALHDDVMKWKHFPRYWPFVRGIHRSPVNSPHKGQWRGALIFPLICTRINGWVNNGGAGDMKHYRAHYDVTVMVLCFSRPYHTAGHCWNYYPGVLSLRQVTAAYWKIIMGVQSWNESHRIN